MKIPSEIKSVGISGYRVVSVESSVLKIRSSVDSRSNFMMATRW